MYLTGIARKPKRIHCTIADKRVGAAAAVEHHHKVFTFPSATSRVAPVHDETARYGACGVEPFTQFWMVLCLHRCCATERNAEVLASSTIEY